MGGSLHYCFPPFFYLQSKFDKKKSMLSVTFEVPEYSGPVKEDAAQPTTTAPPAEEVAAFNKPCKDSAGVGLVEPRSD